jgi:hypothetical protein
MTTTDHALLLQLERANEALSDRLDEIADIIALQEEHNEMLLEFARLLESTIARVSALEANQTSLAATLERTLLD